MNTQLIDTTAAIPVRIFKIKEAADYLGVSVNFLRKEEELGNLRFMGRPNSKMVRVSSVELARYILNGERIRQGLKPVPPKDEVEGYLLASPLSFENGFAASQN